MHFFPAACTADPQDCGDYSRVFLSSENALHVQSADSCSAAPSCSVSPRAEPPRVGCTGGVFISSFRQTCCISIALNCEYWLNTKHE